MFEHCQLLSDGFPFGSLLVINIVYSLCMLYMPLVGKLPAHLVLKGKHLLPRLPMTLLCLLDGRLDDSLASFELALDETPQ